MHQDKAVELAREAAVACGERHSYMPPTEPLAEVWQPHRWVIDAMLLAAHEAEQQRDAYRAGNTDLLGLLMKIAEGTHADVPSEIQRVLAAAGLLNGVDGTLNWQALEDRKPKQQPKPAGISRIFSRTAVNPRIHERKPPNGNTTYEIQSR